jgi:hypothetical protein
MMYGQSNIKNGIMLYNYYIVVAGISLSSVALFLKCCSRSTEFVWVIIMNIQKELIKNMDVV